MKELIDVVDENGYPTGKIVDREFAHLNGIWHRTAHLWLARIKNGEIQVLLQKRSKDKESYPNCFDISSAGHIPAGDDYKISAIRELKEELGIQVNENELLFCGDRKVVWDDCFLGKPYHDRQYSRVFLLWLDLEEAEFIVSSEEVESVCWMNFVQCLEGVRYGLFQNCIAMEELLMLQKVFNQENKQ